MDAIPFTKMQGCGNDYVFIDLEDEASLPESLLPSLARCMSNRHYGIGSDGLILLTPSTQADFRMRIFNADGSEAEMCGNGIRCAGKLFYDKKHSIHTHLSVQTAAGIRKLTLHYDNKHLIRTATVDMAAFSTKNTSATNYFKNEILTIEDASFSVTCLSMGNPHAVLVTEDIDTIPVEKLGPHISCHPRFPARTNVEFVQILSPQEIRMRVWERGSGETLACGTGACAAVMTCIYHSLTNNMVKVHLPGGILTVTYHPKNGHLYLTGDAVTVYEGIYYLPETDSERGCVE